MFVKKIKGKVHGASFTAAERKALDIEIMKQLAEYTRKHALEMDAVFSFGCMTNSNLEKSE